MFYILLRLLYEEMESGMISPREYRSAVEKVAMIHGFRRNGIR
ncbi:MAG TPA: hypothetical protein PKO25_05035 [Spirochaetota bacterium]|nr:hypothetical protein [Spirochaetota bacterium]OPZ38293.1 MAG: hypothetical protein BWY96_01117 [Spirochaetes bacterium ADurb.BinA120]HNU91214.1 hypothetical protein [Spirochaetota bacterium]HPI14081.1 hypothetical protein [Spirochaetota bacterium]HPV97847.1 hypothetical protein [Spirochaetota bacterium]